MNLDLTPDPAEVVQVEQPRYDAAPIDVQVCGPTNVRELPANGYPGYKTERAVGTAVAVKLMAMEPRRKYAVITATDQDIWISSSQAGAQAGASGSKRIAAVVPYVIGHVHEIWACAVTGSTDIGVESVNWSE